MANNRLPVRATMLLTLSVLLASCVTSSPPIAPPSVQPPQRPPLPPEGRQPPIPSICSPTCSAGLTRERENWRQSLTNAVPLAPSVSAGPEPLSPEN
ncbi:hypothetical protein SAMN03159371_00153 [Variovorax sp. NFACC28]|nr:hypothetical protein SAMN03159371_00153 [Variovorax sp. NFACC28]SEF71213.1 hypothetical protein SAMN03159365_00665 [Variovorax sp. NFACC29]SFB76735.1 hypothetical protein SAMN03159379_00664 [Variovorax sp. NFACC26]SFG76391.1 hypothetical protein SAMN03159447_04787 [Variovorax sp. NFACC27]